MSSQAIVTLDWNGHNAYGPRGVLYTLTPLEGRYSLAVEGKPIGGLMTLDNAQKAALDHASATQASIENEVAAMNNHTVRL